jgi:putative Mg2+ transporter-C (MgtC) family protein
MSTITPLAQGLFFERLGVATGIGLVIGLERQWRQRTAGLHTVTIVAVGAALFTSLPELLGVADGLRIAGQIVTGIGFLAGGVILRDGFSVRGLVTAATLWATAAVGVLAGSGLELNALVGGLTILAVNLFALPLANAISMIPRGREEHIDTTYTMRVSCLEAARTMVRERVLQEIRTTTLTLSTMSSAFPANGSLDLTVTLTKPGRDTGEADHLKAGISKIDGVTSVSWEAQEHTV